MDAVNNRYGGDYRDIYQPYGYLGKGQPCVGSTINWRGVNQSCWWAGHSNHFIIGGNLNLYKLGGLPWKKLLSRDCRGRLASVFIWFTDFWKPMVFLSSLIFSPGMPIIIDLQMHYRHYAFEAIRQPNSNAFRQSSGNTFSCLSAFLTGSIYSMKTFE